MLAASTAWFSLAVVADLAALLGSDRVVDLDGRLGRLVPAVAIGFVLQTLTGALTYLLPAVWGRGAQGNRTLTRALEVGWPARMVALNLGVALLAFGPEWGWAVIAGRWLPVSRLACSCCWPGRSWPGGWSGTPAAKSGPETRRPG
jgi:nitrite reductase (NO-forming)